MRDTWILTADGEVIAYLSNVEIDWPWRYALITRQHGFERYVHLLASSLALLSDDNELPDDDGQRFPNFDALHDVELCDPDGSVVDATLRVDVMTDRAWWR